MQELHTAPPSKSSVPYGILVVCHINLWPTVRIELGQEGLNGTVAPVLSRLKVVWINTVESGEVPLVVYRIYISSVNL